MIPQQVQQERDKKCRNHFCGDLKDRECFQSLSMTRLLIFKCLLIGVLLVSFPVLVLAQSETSGPNLGTSSAYVYSGAGGSADQLKIYTYIWGQVKSPGLYLVPDNTDLLTLISLAGGPTENAKLTKVRIVRSSPVDEDIIWVDFKEYIETANKELVPIMKPGDTVIVAGSTFYAFSKVTSFLSNVVIVLSVYNIVANLTK